MAGTASSVGRAHELLRELRLGIRRIEVVGPGTKEKDVACTSSTIEVCAPVCSVEVHHLAHMYTRA